MNNKVNEALLNANESLNKAWESIESLINVADENNTFVDTYKEAYWETIRTRLTDVFLELASIKKDLQEAKLID